jgi:probable phosphoglycerate mutase
MVSSNGRLRYFLKLIDSEFERRVAESNFKVATGRVCLIDITNGAAKLELWNEQPEMLAQFLEN